MSKTISELDKQKLAALQLYAQLVNSKFGKTKKEKYREVANRLKIAENTIISWIRRYYENYLEYIDEIQEEENAKICNFEGLTEKQTAYVIARLYGNSKEKAKEIAGYSKNTKAADIEKNKKVASKLQLLREKLIEDSKLGAEAIVNNLYEIHEMGKKGVEVTETIYHDESNATLGRITSKAVKRKVVIDLAAANRALAEINKVLGYDYFEEQKLLNREQPSEVVTRSDGEEVVRVSDDDF
ncbi:helix-turn-helix domain-containing protein [uncultured Fusobacterium sp.]|uniref:helix-turn-helix domain-containing protein n=1 Tax=uncultured Fusobacterium sp. TaxID=159267 RepID=UPI0025E5B85C|nr:helix-turn-helix domain-containing protein [uncultured Fusobacterium sp.]